MPNSPTIVSAALSDKELQDSINKMVANFDKGLQDMLDHSNKYVEKIQESLQKIGNTNFGAKGSNDGGVAKQTKEQKEATNEAEKRVKKEKEINLTLDQRAEIMGRMPREMRMPDMAKSARESFQAFYKGFNEQARQLEPLIQSWERLLQSRHTGNIEQIAQQIRNVKSEIAAVIREQANLSKTKPQGYIDEIAKRNTQIKALRDQLVSLEAEQQKLKATDPFKDNPYLDRLRAKHEELANAMRLSTDATYRLKQATAEELEIQRKRAEESIKSFYTHTMKMPTDQYDVQLAKLENIRALLQRIRSGEANFFTTTQVTGLEKEERRLVGLIGNINSAQQQVTSSTQQATQSAQRYTEEIRKQLAAITSKKDATKAFEQISLMPSNTMDEIKAKGQALVELVKKVKDTPLVSQSNVKLAEKMIGSLANQYRALKEEKEKVANTQTVNAAAENTTRRSLEQEKQDLERLKALQGERRQQIIQTGIAAQQQARILRESIGQQMQSSDYTKQVDKVKELQNALTEMKNAYKQPIDSSIKKALEEDIAITQKALDIAKRYNMTVAGLGAVGIGGKAPTDTLAAYSAEAQRLAGIYKNLSTEERRASAGQGLKRKYQELSHTASQVRKELERPINLKDAMKGGENSIDDLAYKIQRLQSYKRGLDFKTQAGEIQEVDNKIKSLNTELNKYLATAKNVQSQNTALARSWNYAKNRLAFYFTVGASTSFIKNLIEVRSQYEMNERALGILVNSAERGTQIFNELSQMALVSPYTLIELSAAAKQLTAYDVAAKDVVDTTRRLADMAAAVGIPIERLTYALGQIKAYGYLNSRDARMFANAGIPLVKQLSDYYTELEGRLVSTADVYDRIKKKAIDYNEVMEVINKMTDQGGKFFDFQAKMADTLKVRLANLTLAWNNMLNDMGKESQGVLTWGIGALREMFLRWKQLDSLIKNAAWVLGIRTALMFIAYSALKVGAALGVTNKQMALSSVFGTRLAGVLKTVAASFKAIVTSPLTWWSLLAIAAVEATQALLGVNEAQKALNESIRNGANNNYDNISKFLEQYKEVRDSLYKTVTKPVPNGMLNVQEWTDSQGNKWHNISREYTETLPQDIDKNEAKKAWEAVREQIELTVASSDKYIGNLLSISNMSERVRQGFNLLDDVQVVNAALKELDDDTIKVSKDLSAWWNVWQAPDGLIGNLEDLVDAENELIETYGSVEAAKKRGGKLYTDYEKRELANFRNDLQETTDSIINFIELKGWSGDESKINQVFEQITQKLVLDNQLDPQKAFTLQTEVEEARSNAAKQALLQRINDEKEAYKISHDEQLRQSINADVERYNSWNETNGRSKVEWERFTKWLKEQHISETTAMFRNMDAEDIRSLNFQEGKHAEWVTRMVTQYAKEHKMSYDDAFGYLKSWVTSANQWSIFIPMTISTEDSKTVYKQLGEYDKAVDEADAQIKRLTKRINELNAKKKKSKEETKELANAEQELADARKAKADAEAKGGHGKKEKKDEKAANKAAKQAEAELQKALKDELSTIEKVRSIYKDLTKEGMSHADAVERATRGWDETVNAINKVLQKNGLQKLDLSKFAGIENPRELVNMLQSQLNTLLKRGAKPAEIKELQTKVNTLEVDADKYDLTKITKGLNNELGKLKDEYELAVELDANPELGGMFLDMFGIDPSSFSHNIDDYMFAVQSAFEKARKELGYGVTIDVFKANDDEWKKWGEWVGLSGEALDNFKARFVSAQGVAKKWATDVVNNTKKLEYELAGLNDKIAIKEKEQVLLHERIEKEKNETTKHYLELTYQSNEKAIDELRSQALSLMPEYARVFNSIAEYSAGVSRRLQRDLMKVFDEAKYDSANKKWTLTGSDGKQTILNDTQYRKEREKLTREMRKSQAPFKKIKEAFKPSDKNGVVDYAKGIELISGEVQKLGSVASEVGNLAQIFGADEQTVEIINDVATSLNGVATAGQGISQIASGDYIAGAASVLSGITSVIGAWADNSNKRIDAEIKESERAVKRLELAYVDLQQAVDKAMGTAVIGAKQATIANKELQLAEIKRQIQLERSRKSKDRDEDKILELQKQYKELFYEIQNGYTEIVDDLMGTDVSSFAENLVSSMIDAFKRGEDYMKVFNEKFDEMIDNMIMKSIVSRVVSSYLNKIWDDVDRRINERSKDEADEYAKLQDEVSNRHMMSDEDIRKVLTIMKVGTSTTPWEYARTYADVTQKEIDDYRKAVDAEAEAAKARLDAATEFTDSDIDYVMSQIADVTPELAEKLKEILGKYYKFGEGSDKNLSALQAGISGVSEETAGALEAITNGISQQCYLQSDILTQIRDTVQSFDIDIQTASLSQILLQLQSSYQLQQSMLLTMENWTNPSGNAVRVELIS